MPPPQCDEAENAGESGEREHETCGDRLSRWLVRSSPDPTHGREADENQDENRGSEAYRGHDGRFWRSGSKGTIVSL
jgi:hypothetical protein